MKQTTVIWLQEALEQTILTPEQIMQTIGLFVQALEMEKEQIMTAYVTGYLEDIPNPSASHYYECMGEQYYNETFKSE